MFLILIVWSLTWTADTCGAHVYCQDSHASPWTPLGHSCPVNCASVVETVKRLQHLHYADILNAEPGLEDNATTSYERSENGSANSRRNVIHSDPSVSTLNKLDLAQLYQLQKILHNEKAVEELQRIFKNAPAHRKDEDCNLFFKLLRYRNDKGSRNGLSAQCARRCDVEKDFLKRFTVTLNKYAADEHAFDEQLTQVIVQKVLDPDGDGDLHQGRFDVRKLLNYVKVSIMVHSQHAKQRSGAIVLKSKHCLNVYVSGCFCIPGFIEHQGQCVQPEDCFDDDKAVRGYLARIIIQ